MLIFMFIFIRFLYINTCQYFSNLGLLLLLLLLFFIDSPNRRSFRSPGGVVRGLDSVYGAKTCARELDYVVSRNLPWSPVVSRGLPWYATRR